MDRMGEIMYKKLTLNALEDYFIPYSSRMEQGIYFYRINKWNPEVEKFFEKIAVEIGKSVNYIREKIPNPNENQLSYFDEMIGRDFSMEEAFFQQAIKKWLPRLNGMVQHNIAVLLYQILLEYQEKGKNQNILFNIYIKYMCWLYYKFEPILLQLGGSIVPKVVYENQISEYELRMLFLLAGSGCDIILIEKDGNHVYQTLDADKKYADLYICQGEWIPADFSIYKVREKVEEKRNIPQIPKECVKKNLNTNAWLTDNLLLEVSKKQTERKDSPQFYYNVFASMWGAEDKNTYYNDMLKWKLKIESAGRKVSIIEEGITPPDYLEVSRITRGNYKNEYQVILDMQRQLVVSLPEIKKYVKNAFAEILQEEIEQGYGVQKLLNRAIILVCWLNKFIPKLFKKDTIEELNVVVYFGECDNRNEQLFLRILARLPLDILILNPDLSKKTELEDNLFFETKLEQSLPKKKFPTELEEVRFGTVAYHAEQDLNTILYQDTGMYRNRQFKKAIPITLQTTYEEIGILWEQDAVYRPNFEILEDRVMVPVIFSKISGVPGDIEDYWYQIAKMETDNSFIISRFPYVNPRLTNPFRGRTQPYYQNGRLQVQKIKEHSLYPYSFLREEIQDYMFDKMQQLLHSKIIIGENQADLEGTIIATLLNMEKSIVRMIQKYDFTKAVPKLILIHTDESTCSMEDSILVAYLNLIGFDIAIFVPTGYRSIERYYNKNIILEHQVGEYRYDLRVPNLKKIKRKRESFAEKLFRRGR